MTRINIIQPSELTDQHLIAEYREITMVPAALKRTLASKAGLIKSKIKDTFTLNAGHVYFFYDKGKYLNDRYDVLVQEMKDRGFSPDPARKFPKEIFPDHMYNDWMPTLEEQKIVRERIALRISAKADWYRTTKPIQR
tara:strand:+ start:344 stop:757 length:414 start_codon:yes stop_codon:yes gene_type:complete